MDDAEPHYHHEHPHHQGHSQDVLVMSMSSTDASEGTFPVKLVNNTSGRWTDDQVFAMVLAQTTDGWHYLKADGTYPHVSHLDAEALGHLTKNGINYPNMSFTMAECPTFMMPNTALGGRVWISVGSPLYISITSDDSGYVGPDYNNPTDPNVDVYWDFYEFAYQYGVVAFGGNTTQVDAFGFPLAFRLEQESRGYDQTNGITITRDELLSKFSSTVGSAFAPLTGTYRILSPRSSPLFQRNGPEGGYMQSYIDAVWEQYTNNQFTHTSGAFQFSGRVVDGVLQFERSWTGGQDGGSLNKPTTTDVVQGSGALANADMSTVELYLGREFCAAFNRGVAEDTSKWNDPTQYYNGSIKNDYAAFFHTVAIDGLAYAFSYDDVNDQSGVKILSNFNPPSLWTLEIGW
jgi:hypothetical protein